MQQLPLPYETHAFTALMCVGVLTYIPDTDGILREFCRVVQSGGLVVFTQREDLFTARDDITVVQQLDAQGVCEMISIFGAAAVSTRQ